YTVMIEYYKLEEWAFKCVTVNPQMMRHQVLPAIAMNNDERASTMMDYTRPLFAETEYDLLHRPEENPFDPTKLGDSVLWTKEITNTFVSNTLLWPHRDNNQLDLNEQFHTLVQQRELGHHRACRCIAYDMQAETMSPHIPPSWATLLPTMPMGHLKLAMRKASMHIHAPPRSPGLLNYGHTRATFIQGLSSLLSAPLYGFDSQMFIIQPIDLYDDRDVNLSVEARAQLIKAKMWNNDSTNNPQLMGLTIGNLRGEYVSALLPEIVITEDDVPPCLPDALRTFFDDHTFFVWNRQKIGNYFLEEMGYNIGPNFVSIDGLLQVADIHIGCILRTIANSDIELEEMMQLVCSSQTLHATVADNMRS
ncbi:MAG: hypothetical protein GY737_24870, partial [Desulfobacteraceae bacterium]|nr:hypothetical protein [Desulfobacteraceae bacterium]